MSSDFLHYKCTLFLVLVICRAQTVIRIFRLIFILLFSRLPIIVCHLKWCFLDKFVKVNKILTMKSYYISANFKVRRLCSL